MFFVMPTLECSNLIMIDSKVVEVICSYIVQNVSMHHIPPGYLQGSNPTVYSNHLKQNNLNLGKVGYLLGNI